MPGLNRLISRKRERRGHPSGARMQNAGLATTLFGPEVQLAVGRPDRAFTPGQNARCKTLGLICRYHEDSPRSLLNPVFVLSPPIFCTFAAMFGKEKVEDVPVPKKYMTSTRRSKENATMDRLGIGVLSFAHGHVQVYCSKIKTFPDAVLVAAWDDDEERGMASAERHGMEFVPSVDALLARDDIHTVIITSETNKHADLIEAACAAREAHPLPEADGDHACRLRPHYRRCREERRPLSNGVPDAL